MPFVGLYDYDPSPEEVVALGLIPIHCGMLGRYSTNLLGDDRPQDIVFMQCNSFHGIRGDSSYLLGVCGDLEVT